MKLTHLNPQTALVLALALTIAACANQREPAKQALDNVDAAINAAAPDATKYIPEEFSALQNNEADLKAAFDRKDYEGVISGAPSVLAGAKNLAQAAAARKQEVATAMTAQWTDLSSSIPKSLATVTEELNTLGKSRHQRKGVDLAAAKSALKDAQDSWNRAQTSFTSGNVEEALKSAKDSQGKTAAAAAAIKMTPPPT
jgi:hypothetical protein